MGAIIDSPLVVVLIIDQHGIRAYKCEGHAPVVVYPYRKMPFEFSALSGNVSLSPASSCLGISRFIQAL